MQFLTAARNSLSGTSAGASQELQQLAQAAAEPLLSLGAGARCRMRTAVSGGRLAETARLVASKVARLR